MSFSTHLQGGVTTNANGFSFPAQSTVPSIPMYTYAMALANKGKSEKGKKSSSSSSSYSSPSSKVSIVECDDFFDKEGWCEDELVKPDGTSLTEKDLKDNPVLGITYDNCDMLFPIPSYKSMKKVQNDLIKELVFKNDPRQFAMLSDEKKKEFQVNLSKDIIMKYVKQCGYGKDAIGADCFMDMDVDIGLEQNEDLDEDD